MNGAGGGSSRGPGPGDAATSAARRRLRPAPLSSLFEIAARIIRRHWTVLLAISAVFGIPGALLEAAAGIPFGQTIASLLPEPGSTAPVVITETDARELAEGLLLATGGSLVAGILAAIAAVGFAWVVWRDYHGRRVPASDALGRSLARALVALGTALLAGLATAAVLAVGAASVLGVLAVLAPGGVTNGGIGAFAALILAVATGLTIVVLSVRWSLAASLVALEPVGPVGALRRSWHLTGDATLRTFGALLLVALVVTVLSALVGQLLALLLVDLVLAPLDLAVLGETLVSAAVTVLFAPVGTVVMTVYLLDQMVRRDGWDLPAPEPVTQGWGPAA